MYSVKKETNEEGGGRDLPLEQLLSSIAVMENMLKQLELQRHIAEEKVPPDICCMIIVELNRWRELLKKDIYKYQKLATEKLFKH
jgi:hypothetical protein